MEACLALFNRRLQSFVVHNKKHINFVDMTDDQILHFFFEVPLLATFQRTFVRRAAAANKLRKRACADKTDACGGQKQTRAENGNRRVLDTD